MQFEEKVDITASAEKIFAFYADVSSWASWDPDVKEASIEGSFTSGSTGSLLPPNAPKAKIYFIEVILNQSFTVESRLPLCVMRFEHELSEIPDTDQTRALHRVNFSGLLSPLFGRLIGSQIQKGLPHTLQGLKLAVEQNT
jgi:Polyketide cyclase / dehydrase and lipid transport